MDFYLKTVAKYLLPERLFTTIQSIRSRNQQVRVLKKWGVSHATREMVEVCGATVLDGPFKGMKYPKASLLGRNGIPILFGTYELELHPVIEQVATKSYEFIVDIGSAEGYYAVGLALRTNNLVHAFDCEPRERHYVRQMAEMNGVGELVRTRSWCDAITLARLVHLSRCLVISDCEGFEIKLFDEAAISALRNSDVIIELHENVSGISVQETLERRFQSSHDMQVVNFDSSNRSSVVPNRWERLAREIRPEGQRWLFLTPISLQGLERASSG
jgi:hypothetical protein